MERGKEQREKLARMRAVRLSTENFPAVSPKGLLAQAGHHGSIIPPSMYT